MLSLTLTGLLIKYLSNALLDIPNQRSSHSKPVLRGGGLGFILAFAIAGIILAFSNFIQLEFTQANYISLWLGLFPLAIIGFLDDYRDISAHIRYLVQLSSATIVIANFGIVPFPGLASWGIIGTVVATILSLVAVTALINFYNFMDGLDGFVASIAALQLCFLGFYLQQPIFFFLVAALLGFLWWNWSPAKIFMGDIGSTVLGASVAIELLSARQETLLAWSALTITFPLIGDTIYTLICRILQGENIFEPHRTHIYQRLQQSGLTHPQVATIYLITTSIFGIFIYYLNAISIGINLLLTIIAIAIAEIYLKISNPNTQEIMSKRLERMSTNQD